MCRVVRALYSSWMSASVMMIAYVLYNMCRFSFNCTYRDKLTLIIQVLSLASLITRCIEGGMILAIQYEKLVSIFTLISSVLFNLAVSVYFFAWLDIRYLIKYQPPQTDDTAEEQKRKFNRCEKKLIVGLIVVQFAFVLLGAANAIINRILDEDDD